MIDSALMDELTLYHFLIFLTLPRHLNIRKNERLGGG